MRKVKLKPGTLFMIDSKTSPANLARLLGTSHQKLTYLAYSQGISNFYTTFEINKKNGEKRTINAPIPQLKIIQQRLKTHLEKLYKPHVAASAFIEGRGIIYNAKKHTKKAVVLNLDLKDFYHHINFGRVRGLLRAKPYELRDDTAILIAHLCCLNRHLPQGSPVSPLISNMICRTLDHQLSKLAKSERAFYTRYADDITLSFREITENRIFKVEEKHDLKKDINEIIEKNGFKINHRKTRIQFHDERQTVTGLKVNQKVNIDRRFVRTTKAMIHSLSIDPTSANIRFQDINGDGERKLEHVVFGRINYIGMIKGRTSSTYRMLASKFNNLDFGKKAPLSPKSIKDDLENKLNFRKFENYGLLESTTYVVSFEGLAGLSVDQELIQGTAFVLKGNKIITASHIFEKAGSPIECFLYKISNPGKKFRAKLITRCPISDIAYLEFIEQDIGELSYLKIAKNLHLLAGYKVSLVGFPQLQAGHKSVSIIPSTIVNAFTRSTYNHLEVDNEISGGNSGGPVVNAYMEVVGMVTMGKNVTVDIKTTSAEIEGTNAFISAEHFEL